MGNRKWATEPRVAGPDRVGSDAGAEFNVKWTQTHTYMYINLQYILEQGLLWKFCMQSHGLVLVTHTHTWLAPESFS